MSRTTKSPLEAFVLATVGAFSLLMLPACAGTYAQEGATDKAASVYPRLVQLDPSRQSVVSARNDALSGILKVQNVRKEYGMPATCA